MAYSNKHINQDKNNLKNEKEMIFSMQFRCHQNVLDLRLIGLDNQINTKTAKFEKIIKHIKSFERKMFL